MTTPIPPLNVEKPVAFVGCGILHKEVDYLIEKNAWNLETQFLVSALHHYLEKLSCELNQALDALERH